MKLEKYILREILTALAEAYPRSLETWEELSKSVGGDQALIGHLVYLNDKGLIEGSFKFIDNNFSTQWDFNLPLTRINADGFDYLEDMNKRIDNASRVAL